MVMNKQLQVTCLTLLKDWVGRPGLTVYCQDINIQNMNIELVAQMFKNYQSNVLFHLEGKYALIRREILHYLTNCQSRSYGWA